MVKNGIESVGQNTTEVDQYWRCLDRFVAEVRQDNFFVGSNVALIVVSTLAVIISLTFNPLLLYSIHRNVHRRSPTPLATFLAVVNIFTSVFAQIPFLLSKILIVTSLWKDHKKVYCCFVWAFVYAGRLSSLYSVACVLGITADRYMAVFLPHHYKSKAMAVKMKKVIACVFLLETLHVVLNIVFEWYTVVNKAVGLLQIPAISIFICVVYGKIHMKLKKSNVYTTRNAINVARQKKRTVTSALIVTVFLVCYLPIVSVQAAAAEFQREGTGFVGVYLTPWLIALLFMFSSVNPIVYGFRDACLGQYMKQQLMFFLPRSDSSQQPSSESSDPKTMTVTAITKTQSGQNNESFQLGQQF